MTETTTASKEIDAIIMTSEGWKGNTLSRLRVLINKTDPKIIEEVKWKKPSNPAGVPVWSDGGIICICNVLKNAVRLTFPKGAKIKDPKKLFNTRLDSKTVRAVDFHEGDAIDEASLKRVVKEAAELNSLKNKTGSP